MQELAKGQPVSTLYTPDHGAIADTLLMHGIVKYATATGGRVAVIRNGERYAIEISNMSKENPEIVEWLIRLVDLYEGGADVTDTHLHKLVFGDLEKAGRNSRLRRLKNALSRLNASWLDEYKDGHKDKWGEGRRPTRAHMYRLTLHITPFYGNYVVVNNEVKEWPYQVCEKCFTFVNLGFMYGTAVVSGGDDVVYMTPAPRGRIEFEDLVLLHHAIPPQPLKVPPAPTAAIALLFSLNVPDMIDAELDLLTWRLRRGRVPRVVEVKTYDLTKLVEFNSEIGYSSPRWPQCVDAVMNVDPTALAALAEYVLYGGDVYSVTKELTRIAMNNEAVTHSCDMNKIANVLTSWKP